MAGLRIGVIGCGFYAQNHLHAWASLSAEGAELTAVCDLDRAAAERAARAFGVPHYADAGEMLAVERLDLADIVTRHDTHRALAELTVGAGVATVVQKPFATTWEDAAAIVDAATAAGVWLAVHENFRYQTPLRQVRR
jgi:predicted dehydrogenase